MNEKIKMIEGGVTAAKGFMAASTAAGIKYKNRQDMAMIYSKEPCKSAGTFTTNLVKAAPSGIGTALTRIWNKEASIVSAFFLSINCRRPSF